MNSHPQGISGAGGTVRSEVPACDTQKLGFCPLASHLQVGKATGQERGCLAEEASGAEIRPTLCWPRCVPWIGAVSVQRGGHLFLNYPQAHQAPRGELFQMCTMAWHSCQWPEAWSPLSQPQGPVQVRGLRLLHLSFLPLSFRFVEESKCGKCDIVSTQ